MTAPRDGEPDPQPGPRARPEERGAHPSTERRDRRRGPRTNGSLSRALGLTTLSAVVPGLGLLGTTRRRLGLVLVGLVLIAAGALGIHLARNGVTSAALRAASDTEQLRLVSAALIAAAVVWVGAIALTALLAQPRRPGRWDRPALGVFTALLCLAVVAPVALAVRYIDAHADAVDQVFAADPDGGGASPTSALGDDPSDPWENLPRVNMLLLGSDAGDNREGTRPDTMMVVSIDTHSGDAVLFSVPRNLQNVPVPSDNPLSQLWPEGYNCGNECLMNGIWTEAEAVAEEHPEWYQDDPTPGQTATRQVIETVLGIPIHHTAIVNLAGFRDLVDAMGGVEVNVTEALPISGRAVHNLEGNLVLDPNVEYEWLEPGVQRLDGRQALGYSRSRVTTDDFSRMRRQRCMVGALIDQASPMTLLQRYPQIITALGDNVTTDVPRQDLDEWAELMLLVQNGRLLSLPFTLSNTDVSNPNYSHIRYRVYGALYAPPEPEPAVVPEELPALTAAPTPTPEPSPTPDATVAPPPPDDQESTTAEPEDDLADLGTVCD